MQVELNPDGTRNALYRPRILFENTTYNISLYNPYGTRDRGLYTASPPYYMDWNDHVKTHLKENLGSLSVNKIHPPAHLLHSSTYQNYGMGRSSTGEQRIYRRLHAT
jgi:hypothetical protein